MINENIKNNILEVQEKYSGLSHVEDTNTYISIEGELDLLDRECGIIWDTYSIQIQVPYSFPYDLPKLYLLSKNIPWSYDRHIGINGGCCIAPSIEQRLILSRQYSILDFIEKLVIPFFASQKMFSLGLGWANGEYEHFTLGLIEYYKQKIECYNMEQVIIALKVLCGKSKYKRNEKCFCNSGKKYKKCHYIIMGELLSIDRIYYENDLKEILSNK